MVFRSGRLSKKNRLKNRLKNHLKQTFRKKAGAGFPPVCDFNSILCGKSYENQALRIFVLKDAAASHPHGLIQV